MLLHRLLLLFPDSPWLTSLNGIWFALATFIALTFLALGARHSRFIITLLFVLIGALLGKYATPALSLKIDPSAGAIAAAATLGVLAFIFHRYLIALGLALLLSLSTILTLWTLSPTPTKWSYPPLPPTFDNLTDFLKLYEQALGPALLQHLTLLTPLAFIAGILLTIFLPRLATALFWTLATTTLLLFTALSWSLYHSPKTLSHLPQSTQPQLILLGTFLLLTLLLQYRLAPKHTAPSPPPPPDPHPAPVPA